jgi:hypothetical protein
MITALQFLEMQQRVSKNKLRDAPLPPADDGPESKLQGFIREYCAERKWPCLCGSMAEATHRTLGELDFTIPMPEGRTLFIECKRKGGKLSAAQWDMMVWLRLLGHEAYMVDSREHFLKIINTPKQCPTLP